MKQGLKSGVEHLRFEHMSMGHAVQARAGHKFGVEDALIYSMRCVSSPIVPPSPAPGLRFLVKKLIFFFLFFFSLFSF